MIGAGNIRYVKESERMALKNERDSRKWRVKGLVG